MISHHAGRCIQIVDGGAQIGMAKEISECVQIVTVLVMKIRAEMAQIRKDFAAKMTCPVYEGYPYGHISKSFAIDFLRPKSITADGILKQ